MPELHALSVLCHLDLKTHFVNHCILSESEFMFVLLETRKKWQTELDYIVRPIVNAITISTDGDNADVCIFCQWCGRKHIVATTKTVLCNQFIIFSVNMKKKKSLCTSSLVHICHNLLEHRLCLQKRLSFLSMNFFFYTVWVFHFSLHIYSHNGIREK